MLSLEDNRDIECSEQGYQMEGASAYRTQHSAKQPRGCSHVRLVPVDSHGTLYPVGSSTLCNLQIVAKEFVCFARMLEVKLR